MSSGDLADGLQFALANNLNVHSVTVSLINRIVIDATFRESDVELLISEPTDLGTVSVRGVAQEK